MLAFIIRRLLQSVVVLVMVSLLVFAIGNPIDILANPDMTQLEREQLIASFGLDKPLWTQYVVFVGKALQGDLGNSFVHSSSAIHLILEHMPATLELAFAAIAIAIVVMVGISVGLWAGLRANEVAGKSIMLFSILGFSLPTSERGKRACCRTFR